MPPARSACKLRLGDDATTDTISPSWRPDRAPAAPEFRSEPATASRRPGQRGVDRRRWKPSRQLGFRGAGERQPHRRRPAQAPREGLARNRWQRSAHTLAGSPTKSTWRSRRATPVTSSSWSMRRDCRALSVSESAASWPGPLLPPRIGRSRSAMTVGIGLTSSATCARLRPPERVRTAHVIDT